MLRRIFTTAIIIASALTLRASDPMATNYNWEQCQGTYMPYPSPEHAYILPDSLTPVMLNHVGRHGSRFPSSAKNPSVLRNALMKINDKADGLSPTGKELLKIVDRVIETASGRWGSITSLGTAEQRGIASRMFQGFRPLFSNHRINAISSYSPRCILSMYEFAHQLSRLDNNIDITTSSGRCNSPMLRFFDHNDALEEFIDSESYKTTLDSFIADNTPTTPLKRLANGNIAEALSDDEAREAVAAEFALLTGLSCMNISCYPTNYFTAEEQNQLWSVANMKHYLHRSASTLSTIPADIAAPLLNDIISSFDLFIKNPDAIAPVQLRFGHAETLMPLLSLMHLDGCYYVTNYFDTVGKHWCDFHVSPMAANLQLVLLKSTKGNLYLLTLLNERPVPLTGKKAKIYTPWTEARDYLLHCIPFDF